MRTELNVTFGDVPFGGWEVTLSKEQITCQMKAQGCLNQASNTKGTGIVSVEASTPGTLNSKLPWPFPYLQSLASGGNLLRRNSSQSGSFPGLNQMVNTRHCTLGSVYLKILRDNRKHLGTLTSVCFYWFSDPRHIT